MEDRLIKFKQALLDVDRVTARELINAGYNAHDPSQIIEQLIVPALEDIGTLWEHADASLSQVYMSARICEDLIDTVLPSSSPNPTGQTLVAIALLDDYHALGKIIVYSSLRASGIDVQDLGRMTVEELVRQVVDQDIKILLISVLMLPSALKIKELKKQLLRENSAVRIVVGGAPFRFDKQLWQEVGADAMGNNSADAIKVAHKMITEMS